MSQRIASKALARLSRLRSTFSPCSRSWRMALLSPGLLLTACVANTMQGYVGQDVRTVMLDHGPPANEFNLGDGTRAFQWSKTSIDSSPGSAVTTTSKDKKGRKISETQFVGGSETVTNCLYTFIAAWNADRGGWIINGFRQPSLDCAIGGLS